MSLYETMFHDYTLYQYVTKADGEGDYINVYEPVGVVKVAIDLPSTSEKIIASGLKTSVVATALFLQGTPVVRDRYIVSVENPSVAYRITSEPTEKKAPNISSLPFMQADVVKTEFTP